MEDLKISPPGFRRTIFALLILLLFMPTLMRKSSVSDLYYYLFLFSFISVIITGLVCLRNKENFWPNYITWSTNIYFASLGSIPIVFEGFFRLFVFICLAGNFLASFVFSYFVLKRPEFSNQLKDDIKEGKVLVSKGVSGLEMVQFIDFFAFYFFFAFILFAVSEFSTDFYHYNIAVFFILGAFNVLIVSAIKIQNQLYSCHKGMRWPEIKKMIIKEMFELPQLPAWGRWMVLQLCFFCLFVLLISIIIAI